MNNLAMRFARIPGRHKIALSAAVSLMLLIATWFHWLPFPMLEMLGIITGMACVILAVKLNILNFPAGLACNICFMILFYKAHLYGIMGVQVVYLALGIHGWYHWKRQSQNTVFKVSRLSARESIILTAVSIPAAVGLIWYLRHIGDASPYLDATTTVLSLIAQLLLNLKKVDNWSIGAATDVIYTTMYITQGLYLTSLLYAFYFIMCIQGYREWSSTLKSQTDLDSSTEPVEELETVTTG